MAYCEYIDVHTHHSERQAHCAIYNLLPSELASANGLVSAGIHPWLTQNFTGSQLETFVEQIEILAHQGALTALGECGMDKLKGASLDLQRVVFKKHLFLAKQYRLPLILHLVKCDHLILPLLKDFPEITFCYHGFNRSSKALEPFLKLGGFISFGAAIMSNSSAAKSLAWMPENQLLLETDDSGFGIQVIYERAAAIRELSLHSLKTIIRRNYECWLGR